MVDMFIFINIIRMHRHIIKKYRPYNMSIYIVLIYFLGISIGFLEVPGSRFFARAPVQNKPPAVLIFVPCRLLESIIPRSELSPCQGQLRVSRILPGPGTMQLIRKDIFINMFLPRSSRVRALVYGLIKSIAVIEVIAMKGSNKRTCSLFLHSMFLVVCQKHF